MKKLPPVVLKSAFTAAERFALKLTFKAVKRPALKFAFKAAKRPALTLWLQLYYTPNFCNCQ